MSALSQGSDGGDSEMTKKRCLGCLRDRKTAELGKSGCQTPRSGGRGECWRGTSCWVGKWGTASAPDISSEVMPEGVCRGRGSLVEDSGMTAHPGQSSSCHHPPSFSPSLRLFMCQLDFCQNLLHGGCTSFSFPNSPSSQLLSWVSDLSKKFV